MATVSIDEGQAKEVPVTDNLLYPNINSCLSITSVFPDNKRVGAHAVLFPEGAGQLNLQQLCDYIFARKGNSTGLYVIGYIGIWDRDWSQLPQTKDLMVNGKKVTNAAGIAIAMGYPPAGNLNFDVDKCNAPGGSYNVYFDLVSGKRVCKVKDKATGNECPLFLNKTW